LPTETQFSASPLEKSDSPLSSGLSPSPVSLQVSLLTGGIDKPYVYGLATALMAQGVGLDIIGSDEVDSPDFHTSAATRFLNLRGDQGEATFTEKMGRISRYYTRLLRYAAVAQPEIFHILWNNRFQALDRTALMLYYKMLGKKVVFTAHNVNAARRDSKDSLLNRITLRIQYQLADHIFVHTEKMKSELMVDFGVPANRATVIPFGINNAVPHTDLTPAAAKSRLGIRPEQKMLLFFGRIGPYKGLEYLVDAFEKLVAIDETYTLVIAGKPKGGAESYLASIRARIKRDFRPGRVIEKIEFIPDEDTEVYFKAADVLMLPYTEVFQSGVLFLGYSFGLPVIATDIGSMSEGIADGSTGLLAKPRDAADLARAIGDYFASDMYTNLNARRGQIRKYAMSRNSWDVVGEMTASVYSQLRKGNLS
jgi:D-inositol-3-phosphate glycosyltransferase